MSDDVYFVIKPDAVDRGIWTDIIAKLAAYGRVDDVRFFCPSDMEVLRAHSAFCFDLDVFAHWLELYRQRLSLIGRIEGCRASLEELGRWKGTPFQPAPHTLRGSFDIRLRVTNAVHIPASKSENVALQELYENRFKVEQRRIVEVVERFLSHSRHHLDRDALLEELRQRIYARDAYEVLNALVASMKASLRGSSAAKTLADNFLQIAEMFGLPINPVERLMLRQLMHYPNDIGRTIEILPKEEANVGTCAADEGDRADATVG